MNRTIIPLILALPILHIPCAFAWDPLTVLNGAVQSQVNRQIYQGVTEVFRSIGTPSTGARPTNIDIRDARPGEVVIYTTPTCGYCKQARAHLQSRNIPFLEKDVSGNPQAQAEWKSLGGRGVPLALIGSQKLTGFSAASYDSAWARFQAEQSAAPAVQPTPSTAASGFSASDLLVARIARVKLLATAQPDAKVIGHLAKSEEVIYLGEARGRYLKVKGADLEGWADQALLAKP